MAQNHGGDESGQQQTKGPYFLMFSSSRIVFIIFKLFYLTLLGTFFVLSNPEPPTPYFKARRNTQWAPNPP